MSRFFGLSKTLPFLLCLLAAATILALEQIAPSAWKTVKTYLLSDPFFYHSLAIYLIALVLALFTYRSLYNFKILLAGVFFLMAGVVSLLYFLRMPVHLGRPIPPGGDENLRVLLYVAYSLDLLLIALVPSYLPQRVTRFLLLFLLFAEAALLAAFVRFREPIVSFLAGLAGAAWDRPFALLAGMNGMIAVLALAVSARRRDPYGWPVVGFLLVFCVAFSRRGTDAEKLLFLSLPFLLSLLVLVNLVASLSHRANYDPLMNIYSRGYCNLLLQGRGRPLGSRFALALFDLDHFKKINDRYGHAVGDQVLHAVAQKIREMSLPRGIACRYGGEEILVIFPDTSLSYAERVAREIVSSVAGFDIPISRNRGRARLRVTVSAGVAAAEAATSSTADVLEEADRALYRSKRLGRNRVTAAQRAPRRADA
jgi:diguanylate cyclase (GGDEF)-like protein